MELYKTEHIFSLSTGDVVTKRNLFDLIQYSKVENSEYWSGNENAIGNTPQQGINWVGQLPNIKAVIIKTRDGSYEDDGWTDTSKNFYHYSFKARNGEISYTEKANEVLIKQPQQHYPILLFTEASTGWHFEGNFHVYEISDKYVVLNKTTDTSSEIEIPQDEFLFQEGTRKYVTHLMAERNQTVIKILKDTTSWLCEICSEDFKLKYKIEYIEVHHKVPISTYSDNHPVCLADFALLCPNCHKAVHIYMKKYGYEYIQIKKILSTEA